ncbi:MAG: hypothetical protein M0Z60_12555 [Nitrospiraceae bacterium]|nr:hypothetical protein [Nitrospiraceae bacterium]
MGHQREKSVMRFRDGKMLKGYVADFSPLKDDVRLEEAATGKMHAIRLEEMKAVFFVKSFEGDYEYKEKKSYGIRRPVGNRAFVRFKDGECLVGFLEGKVPWERGFFLSNREDGGMKGFFLLPADEDANNIKVFVVSSAVDDVTVVP